MKKIMTATAICVLIATNAAANPSHSSRPNDVDCLAQNIFMEARGESYMSKMAVAHVTINRARKERTSICRSLQRPGSYSWVTQGTGGAWHRASRAEKDRIREVARTAIERPCTDPTNGATHFHHRRLRMDWTRSMERMGTIDNHTFWRDPRYAELAEARR